MKVKKIFLIIQILFFSINVLRAQEQGKLYKENHPNGTLWRTGMTSEENKPHGTWKYYSENGRIQIIGNWNNGVQHGNWLYFDDENSGELWKKETYSNGSLNGEYELYHERKLYRKGSYKDSLEEGFWEIYNDEGVPEQKGNYENGVPVGKWIVYYTEGVNKGKVEAEITIENGTSKNIKHFSYTEPESYTSEGYYSIGNFKYNDMNNRSLIYYYGFNKDGVWKAYYEDSKLFKESTFNKGVLNGELKCYYKNGNLMAKGTFKEGRIIGLFEEFYDNGNYKLKITSKNGIYDIFEYHENGQVKKVAHEKFNSDTNEYVEHGEWLFYDENGSLQRKERYMNGIKQ